MKYETPDMAIIEPDLIAQYEILASSTGTPTCNIAASVQCSGTAGSISAQLILLYVER